MKSMKKQTYHRTWLLGLLVVCFVIGGVALTLIKSEQGTPFAQNAMPAQVVESNSAVIVFADLPEQAKQTYRLILQGGPFAYPQDGTTFGNYERRLPQAKKGYYREYTVTTPGLKHRGKRRIVCGGLQKTQPDKCFYTADHYERFAQITAAPKH